MGKKVKPTILGCYRDTSSMGSWVTLTRERIREGFLSPDARGRQAMDAFSLTGLIGIFGSKLTQNLFVLWKYFTVPSQF